ncbi:phosphotransferase system, HPr-related protein [Pseudomonas sp. MLB6B]
MAQADEKRAYTPTEIDTIEDRIGSVHPLDFNEDDDAPKGRIGDELPEAEADLEFPQERAAEAGMTGGEALSEGVHEDGVTDDDMSPETLLPDDGALDQHDLGSAETPADQDLTEVDAEEIGAGHGQDEAELAHTHPLDGKPWSDDEIPDDRNNA